MRTMRTRQANVECQRTLLDIEKQKNNKMKLSIFYIILLFAVLGGVGTYFAGRKQNSTERKKKWLKYFIYFFIIILLYSCICFATKIFPCICGLIVIAGLIEIIRLQKMKSQKKILFFSILFVYLLISVGFYSFSNVSQSILLYTLFTVCTFDAFCQVARQLFKKNKICPQISPNKTYEGLFGGLLMSVCTFFIIGKILEITVFFTIIAGIGICVFSFFGDLSASWIKRKYGVKDFSSALPGQGGFLDRFDSFITAGAFVFMFHLIFTIE
jgi:phosphatidate cytidylyltransferase